MTILVRRNSARAEIDQGDLLNRSIWFDDQKASVKKEAERRLTFINRILTRVCDGMCLEDAVSEEALSTNTRASILWKYVDRLAGVPDYYYFLCYLAPRSTGGRAAPIPDNLWKAFIADWDDRQLPFKYCYLRLCGMARDQGLEVPCSQFVRKLLRNELNGRAEANATTVTLSQKFVEATARHWLAKLNDERRRRLLRTMLVAELRS